MISVILCTRNRADQLRRVLETAAAMERPQAIAFEFVLVDNGSTDHTQEVVACFASELPIRYIFEPVAGLSNARNRGVAEARGDYICWTDDDVLIDRKWLTGYAAAFARHPNAAYFGGPIELQLESEIRPKWFEENRASFGNLLAERLLGDVEIMFNPQSGLMPYGANYAVRTQDQRRHLYDPALGVSPLQRRLGEESAVLYALAGEGKAGYWVPNSRVLHIIPERRLTLRYVLEYQRSAGETAAYLDHHGMKNFMGTAVPPSQHHVFGAPIYLWRKTAKRWLGYRVARLVGPSPRWFERLRWYAFHRGAVAYWQKVSRDRLAR